jgi:hypothetical protein
MMKTKAKFQVGDRVLISIYYGPESTAPKLVNGWYSGMGTVEKAPKTSRGKSYLVRYDGGYILNGRDCPQQLFEEWLSPAPENERATPETGNA